MNNRICIITQSPLCRNPRVLKEATTLSTAGYKVQILTGIISADLYRQDLKALKDYPDIKLSIAFDVSASTIISLFDRLLFRFGRTLVSWFNIDNIFALGYGASRYLRTASKIKADLYICHQELATYIGTQLIAMGFKVGFDFEDWYSEDLLPETRAARPVKLLQKLESIALKQATFCLTTSNALANKLAKAYRSPVPKVIYNVFKVNPIESSSITFKKPLKLFWFSQTIGPGRGLEDFIILCGSFKHQLEFHFLGDISEDFEQHLISLLPNQHQLIFHQLVSERDLPKKIAEFDIGLALELDSPPSRNYTITNKFFQYIQSGLPVIASETAGQKEAFDTHKPGIMISQKPTVSEIIALETWLDDAAALNAARQRALQAASIYSWTVESAKLTDIINKTFER